MGHNVQISSTFVSMVTEARVQIWLFSILPGNRQVQLYKGHGIYKTL